MQIVDPSIDLPAASFLPSIPPSISLLSWRYHPSSYSYQFISPRTYFLPYFPSPSLLLSHIHLSKWSPQQGVCVCAYVCALVLLCLERYLSGRWSEEKIVCIINDSLETVKRQIVKVNECVSICLCALSCLSTGIPASLWARRCACLSIFFRLSVFLSGQFAVWGPPRWWRAVGRRPR